jgi:Gnt-I system high-affinity gluconate transporter
VIVCGAMIGKLVAESGAAQKISDVLLKTFGEKNITWALVLTGFIVGIPLFYNVGFVLLVPLIFSIVYRLKLPAVYVGIPMLSALSVTHGLLPPHPSPAALVNQLHADMGKTLMYGICIAIPTIIVAGPLFASTLKKMNVEPLQTFKPKEVDQSALPGFLNSIITCLLPVFILLITTGNHSIYCRSQHADVYLHVVCNGCTGHCERKFLGFYHVNLRRLNQRCIDDHIDCFRCWCTQTSVC